MITVLSKRNGARGEYVGRPSALGNPFVISESGDRAAAIAKYEIWLREQIASKNAPVIRELNRLALIARKQDLALVCWCSPLPCHADIIKLLLEEVL